MENCEKLSGVIVIRKPAGKTSHDMVSFVRKLLHIRRVGHTGTLDPDAVGVLPICIGMCTKASQYIMDSKKRYVATMQLGASTTTQDASGEIICSAPICKDEALVLQTMMSFVGGIKQIPPMYSAVKVGGKKLYELAREGKEVERKPREVQIYDMEILEADFNQGVIRFAVECSKGTYIRTLIHDIGVKLGCFAHMTALERTMSGGFTLVDAYSCEQLIKMAEDATITEAILPTEAVFAKFPKVILNEKDTWRVQNGISIRRDGTIVDQKYRLYGANGAFLCVSIGCDDGVLKMITSFWSD